MSVHILPFCVDGVGNGDGGCVVVSYFTSACFSLPNNTNSRDSVLCVSPNRYVDTYTDSSAYYLHPFFDFYSLSN